jgi:single-strand DNA-binding protein
MAEGLNRCTLLGNLGQDPEVRVLGGGQVVMRMSLATNESYLDRNNVRQERTEWHRCSVWGRRAEALAKILQKGDRLYVEGSLHTSSYEKNGEKRWSTEIQVSKVLLCGNTRGEAADGKRAARAQNEEPPPPAGEDWSERSQGGTDDIPF